MRISHWMPAAFSSLICLSQLPLIAASPVSLEDPDIEKRCSNPCGFYSQLCCTSSQTCITNNGQAVCSDSSSGGGSSGGSSGGSGSDGDYDYYTSTWTVKETDAATYTTTWSARRSPAPTAAAAGGSNSGSGSSGSGSGSGSSGSGSGSCDSSMGESLCGSSCCGPSEVCDGSQCILGSSSIWATATATPPVRGTSDGLSTVTETGNPTATQAFETPVSTDGSPMLGIKAPSDKGLSGGAIAGIVIGTIAGVALLLLICACLCCRGIIDGLVACFGCGKRRRRDDRHHSQGGRPGRTWFGSRPHHGNHSDGGEKKKWGGLAAVGIVLGALALCLGLKRHREHDEKSSYSYPSSYYYSDYYTNSSSASSDRRTRETRRTRDSRRTRRSRARSRRS